MSANRASKPRASKIVALLTDTKFCSEARLILQRLAAAREKGSREEFERAATALGVPFMKKWGVVPPSAAELVDPDSRRRLVYALASGTWGVVPIFPWTTDREVRATVSKIRRVIKKQHTDAQNVRRAQLAQWLEACDVPPQEVAAEVWGRTAGLQRASKEKAIQSLTEDEERKLYTQLRAQGLTPKKIEQRIYRLARGSEAKATAAIRMAKRRYEQRIEALNAALESPIHVHDFSDALTLMFRAVGINDGAQVVRWAAARNALRDSALRT